MNSEIFDSIIGEIKTGRTTIDSVELDGDDDFSQIKDLFFENDYSVTYKARGTAAVYHEQMEGRTFHSEVESIDMNVKIMNFYDPEGDEVELSDYQEMTLIEAIKSMTLVN